MIMDLTSSRLPRSALGVFLSFCHRTKKLLKILLVRIYCANIHSLVHILKKIICDIFAVTHTCVKQNLFVFVSVSVYHGRV